jgi:hypothetical protein
MSFATAAAVSTPRAICVPDLQGEPYEDLLRRMHEILRPETYLEIGCYTGGSLGMATGKVVAIDPEFKLEGNWVGEKKTCMLFQMTSDAFFRQYSPSALFGQSLDMAFLDGMHLAEFLLRDFINTESHCRRNSVVFMHDCIPVDATIADRGMQTERRAQGQHPGWWTGDVWKVVVALKTSRPDLSITAWDAAPTGLVAVTNLDPKSTILSERYFDIIKSFENVDLADYGIERYFSELDIQPTSGTKTLEDIAARFWL